ncbi:30S ribosomal protein S16, partial [candidate division KSB1 bacterium]|nr:30S ribosomal protein S16 [candidate division KSB1 bacterium]
MSVRLRLRRMGKKKQPFYRIVVIDSRAARDGRYIEKLGTYNPLTQPVDIKIEEDRALYWLGQGAIPSFTVKSFLKKKGVLLKWHLLKKGVDEATIEEELKKWQVLQLEKEKRMEALTEQKKREKKAKKAEEAKAEAEPAVKAEAEPEVKVEAESEVKVEEAETTLEAEAKSKVET